MSLDVYLEQPGLRQVNSGSGIFVRENGQMKEISREEWDSKFPGCEPVVFTSDEVSDQVYSNNITHNLNTMAEAAGIYQQLWRPDEIGITKAFELIDPLTVGLDKLRSEPDKFKAFNPPNGWGDYEGLVEFVANYLNACQEYPDAEVRVSR